MEITLVDTALGYIGLIGDEEGLGSVTHFYPSADDCLSEIDLGLRLKVSSRFEDIGSQLKRYTDGDPIEFSGELAGSVGTEFELRVCSELRRIPWGQVISYSALARSIDNLEAVRAVGRAIGRNPGPYLFPATGWSARMVV